jgi:DNA-binding transcriptional MocR family regulator
MLQDQVAELLRRQIEEKIYRPGDRLPSIRELHTQLGVSITTVLNAYSRLETEGWIGAEPKSGFYVRLRAAKPRAATTAPPAVPIRVTSDPLLLSILNDLDRGGAVNMAAANPNPDVLPISTLNRITRVMTTEYPEEVIQYSSFAGYRSLREQIARRMISAGCAMSPDQILITSGCGEALTLSLGIVCRPGDVVAIESPAYYGLLQQLRTLGYTVLEVATSESEGMCLDSLEHLLDEQSVSAVLATPNFNNPIGAMMPDAKKQRLVEMLAAREIPLIEDDVYGELSFTNERASVCKAFDTKGLVIHCSSFSKTLAPGYRIGWVSGGRFHDELTIHKFGSSSASASLQQMVLAEFLQNYRLGKTIEKAVGVYRKNIQTAIKLIHEYFPDDTHIVQPKGGFVLWVELPKGIDSVSLYRQAAAEGILFMPGPAFSSHGLYQNCMRINVASMGEQQDHALRRLGELARSAM